MIENTIKKDIENLFGDNFREGRFSMSKKFLSYLKKNISEEPNKGEDLRGRLD